MIINENRVSQLFGAPRKGQTLLGASAYSISILLHDSETQPGWINTQKENVIEHIWGQV